MNVVNFQMILFFLQTQVIDFQIWPAKYGNDQSSVSIMTIYFVGNLIYLLRQYALEARFNMHL